MNPLFSIFYLIITGFVNDIKALRPKCTGNMQTIAKDMKDAKKECVNVFIKCKKSEDAAVKLIYECMNFDVQLLDHAAIATDAGSNITGLK